MVVLFQMSKVGTEIKPKKGSCFYWGFFLGGGGAKCVFSVLYEGSSVFFFRKTNLQRQGKFTPLLIDPAALMDKSFSDNKRLLLRH